VARRGTAPDPEDVLTWHETGDGLSFTVAEVAIAESRDNVALERAARAAATGIEAQVGYAYRLDRPTSAAWWTDWGGFDLAAEIRAAALLARDDGAALDGRALARAVERDWDSFSRADLKRGFRRWFADLPAAARKCFSRDLNIWRVGARAGPGPKEAPAGKPLKPSLKPSGSRPRKARRKPA